MSHQDPTPSHPVTAPFEARVMSMMRIKLSQVWLPPVSLCVVAGYQAAAGIILFSETFDGGLSNWSPGSGITVSESGRGQVLTFSGVAYGGDAVTIPVSVPNLPGLYLSFDYKGGGGFVGVSPGGENWLAGEAGYSQSVLPFVPLTYDNSWRRYEIQIPAGLTGRIMLEDWASASAHGAFFDNILVADYPGAMVPEPRSFAALAAAGLVGFALVRRGALLTLGKSKP